MLKQDQNKKLGASLISLTACGLSLAHMGWLCFSCPFLGVQQALFWGWLLSAFLSWLTCPKSPSIVPSHLNYFWELFQDFYGAYYILIFSLRIPLLTYHAYYFKNIFLTTSICWVFLSSDALGLEYWDKVNLSDLKTFCVIGCTKNSSL